MWKQIWRLVSKEQQQNSKLSSLVHDKDAQVKLCWLQIQNRARCQPDSHTIKALRKDNRMRTTSYTDQAVTEQTSLEVGCQAPLLRRLWYLETKKKEKGFALDNACTEKRNGGTSKVPSGSTSLLLCVTDRVSNNWLLTSMPSVQNPISATNTNLQHINMNIYVLYTGLNQSLSILYHSGTGTRPSKSLPPQTKSSWVPENSSESVNIQSTICTLWFTFC